MKYFLKLNEVFDEKTFFDYVNKSYLRKNTDLFDKEFYNNYVCKVSQYNVDNIEIQKYLIIWLSKFVAFKIAKSLELVICGAPSHTLFRGIELNLKFRDLYFETEKYINTFYYSNNDFKYFFLRQVVKQLREISTGFSYVFNDNYYGILVYRGLSFFTLVSINFYINDKKSIKNRFNDISGILFASNYPHHSKLNGKSLEVDEDNVFLNNYKSFYEEKNTTKWDYPYMLAGEHYSKHPDPNIKLVGKHLDRCANYNITYPDLDEESSFDTNLNPFGYYYLRDKFIRENVVKTYDTKIDLYTFEQMKEQENCFDNLDIILDKLKEYNDLI
jgi:hypothetical protein